MNICTPHAKLQKNSCEWKLFKNASIEEIFDICSVEKIITQNYVTPIGNNSIHLYIDSYIRTIQFCPKTLRGKYGYSSYTIETEQSFTTDGILTIDKNCTIVSDEFELNINNFSGFHNPRKHNLNEIYNKRHNENLKDRLINSGKRPTNDEYEESNNVTPIAIKESKYNLFPKILLYIIAAIFIIRFYNFFRRKLTDL